VAHGLTETKMQGEYYEIETAERDQRGRFVKPEESRTQLNIPTLNEARAVGVPFSQAELRKLIHAIYDEIKDDILKKVDAYRTYDISEISNLKTILYKFPPRRVY
jgi:hypothetical protein